MKISMYVIANEVKRNEAIAKVLWILHSVTWLGLFVPTYLGKTVEFTNIKDQNSTARRK